MLTVLRSRTSGGRLSRAGLLRAARLPSFIHHLEVSCQDGNCLSPVVPL